MDFVDISDDEIKNKKDNFMMGIYISIGILVILFIFFYFFGYGIFKPYIDV